MHEIWDHNAAMRWAICSPPLLDVHPHHSKAFWPTMQWFLDLWDGAQITPDEDVVLEDCNDIQLPIGRYFERLVAAFFVRHPDYRVVDRNVVITHEGRTIGECDLIVQNCSD